MPSDSDTDTEVQPPDPEALVDALFDYEVVTETEDGNVVTTEEFEQRRGISNDTYMDLEPPAFRETVAKAFDLSEDEAESLIQSGEIDAETVSAYFTLQAHLKELDRGQPGDETLAAMAELVTEISPASPVPQSLRELTMADYESFIEERQDAVIIVFMRDCDPCDATKEILPDLREAAPDGVAFAGVDVAEVQDLLREFEVEAAPTSLIFADGELAESLRGFQTLETHEEAFEAVYD